MLSDYLKTNSRKDHDSIESKVDLVKLAAHPEHYEKLLKAMYGFYHTIEAGLIPFKNEFQNLGINLDERLKLNLLSEDLAHFNVSAETLPVCANTPAMTNIQEAMGVLYVLEGSTMGGQIIFRQLLKSGIISEGSAGGNFFKPYGEATMPMWMKFKESLNKLSGIDDDAVLNKARETFNKMEVWLVKAVA